jgi:hypothetical protein
LGGKNAKTVEVDTEAVEFTLDGDVIGFGKRKIEKSLVVKFK